MMSNGHTGAVIDAAKSFTTEEKASLAPCLSRCEQREGEMRQQLRENRTGRGDRGSNADDPEPTDSRC
jgi:hypothetical protein